MPPRLARTRQRNFPPKLLNVRMPAEPLGSDGPQKACGAGRYSSPSPATNTCRPLPEPPARRHFTRLPPPFPPQCPPLSPHVPPAPAAPSRIAGSKSEPRFRDSSGFVGQNRARDRGVLPNETRDPVERFVLRGVGVVDRLTC